MVAKKHPPVHPGEILMLEFLEPLQISQYRLAKDVSVPPRRINEIVKGTRSITANTALRLGRYFGTSERFWMNLQTHYDLELERDRFGSSLQDEVHVWLRRSRLCMMGGWDDNSTQHRVSGNLFDESTN